jgi:hypothetical protein
MYDIRHNAMLTASSWHTISARRSANSDHAAVLQLAWHVAVRCRNTGSTASKPVPSG